MGRWTGFEEPVPGWRVDGWSAAMAWCTGRRGGVSGPPFGTLNMSYAVRDLSLAVVENRRRALRLAGARSAVWGRLVHGREAAWVDRRRTAPPAADVLLTRDPAVVLAMTYADCVPLWLYAPDIGVVALAHAGWRGTALGVADEAVNALVTQGARAASIEAAIGPAIGACCYQVDEPVVAALDALPDAGAYITSDGDHRFRVDLPGLNQSRLERLGIDGRRVAVARLCTACHPDWLYSHRGQGGRTGRMGGFLCLTDR